MYQKEFVEKIKTHILYSIFFLSCRLWYNVGKKWYSGTGHRWKYNTAHAHCMLG